MHLVSRLHIVDIPTATPIIPRSLNSLDKKYILPTLPEVKKSKMAAAKQEVRCISLQTMYRRNSNGYPYMGLAFGFTLLSHVRTEIYVSVFVLSVHAEYLLFKSPRRRRVFSPVSPFYFSPKCGVAVGI